MAGKLAPFAMEASNGNMASEYECSAKNESDYEHMERIIGVEKPFHTPTPPAPIIQPKRWNCEDDGHLQDTIKCIKKCRVKQRVAGKSTEADTVSAS
jgi:hypothetical protein